MSQTADAPSHLIDLRPIAFVIGRILTVLAALMLIPALIDGLAGSGNAGAFLQAALYTGLAGILTAVSTRNALGRGLEVRQAYLLTVAIWGLVPLFGALPFVIGAPGLSLTDAYFEAVSGITTTGSTVIIGLDDLPAGMNLWRGMLNWTGGLGIAFVAMIFLPVMRIGGMQFFRTEGFDTLGKILPRATDIARQLVVVYAGLTVLCLLTYASLGMEPLDAVVNALATIATGGFSPTDISFTKYQGAGEYAGALFMLLASLPYIRFVQLIAGQPQPVLRDPQVSGYLRILLVATVAVTLWRVSTSQMQIEPAFRETLFNLASVASGTGFFSGSFSGWEGFSMIVAFILGLIGGCSGSSSGALTVFRVQVTARALAAQLRLIHLPNRISPIKYAGRNVDNDVMSALILYVTGYIVTIGVLSLCLTLTGVDAVSALYAIWTSIGNIGYGYGPMVARTGTFVDFSDAAKWVMILAMIMGRLGLLSLFVLVLPRFWQR
jgi:trk system potassium uptake protein